MLMVFMSQPDFACNCHALWKYVKQHTDFETAWIIKKPAYYEILKERGIRCAVYDTVAVSYTHLDVYKRQGMNRYTFYRKAAQDVPG